MRLKHLLIAALLAPVVTFAQNYAEVIRVEPRVYQTNEYHCRQVPVQRQYQQNYSAAGGAMGAIAGAAIGNQIGGGSGRDIATAAGAILGYQLGRGELAQGPTENREYCETRPTVVQRGEVVTFRYRGRIFQQVFE